MGGRMRGFWMTTMAAVLAAGPAAALTVPIDLNSFVQVGNPNAGDWDVAADGTSVLQRINEDQTAYVSPTGFINSSFDGSFGVETSFDNDYVGFVYGFGANESDPFFAFTWKQGLQDRSEAGFTLSRVTGGLSAIPFADHQLDAAGYDVVATDVGAGKGWADNTVYDFKLTYQTTQTTIEVGPDGGPLATIFTATPADFGLTQFTAGRFGFFNYSQSNVRYQGFTQAAAPDPNTAIPLPAAAWMLGAGVAAVAGLRARRRG